MKKKYLVIMQDEYCNLYYMGKYDSLSDALPDVNDWLEPYNVKLEELKSRPGTMNEVFDTDIETETGFVMVRGFILNDNE